MTLSPGRLAPKLLLLLLLMAGVPLLVAFGLSATLFERSLGAGLNPEVSRALSDAVSVFGERVQAEKDHQRAIAAGVADSARLQHALRTGDHGTADRLLDQALSTPSALSISLTPTPGGQAPSHQRERPPPPEGWLRETVELPIPADTGYARLTYTFGLDPAYVARFQEMDARVIRPFNALESDRERRARLYSWSFVFTLGVAILGACVVAVIAGGRVTRRIYRLRHAMAAVAAGKWETRVTPSGHDEVTELMAGFNQMAGQLATGQARIEYLTQISAWQGIARRMAHEIKNPLTPILLSVQQIESAYAGEDEVHRRALSLTRDIVEQEVQTLRRLVDAFSRFAQLPEMRPEPVDLAALCRERLAAHSDLPGLAIDVPDAPLVVAADPGLLRQAIANLLKNAGEALTPTGHPAPRIQLACATVDGGARLSVTDNGAGVPPHLEDSLFEPYVTGRPEGTGLGLAIVKRIALDHGGTVDHERGPDGGARFSLFLPSQGGETRVASRGSIPQEATSPRAPDGERVAGRIHG